MTANLIDEIEKYIPKSMALYDKELLLDNIKIILDEHKFTPPTSPAVNGVDELIEKMKEIFISFHGTQAEERGAERMYNYIMSEIKSLKQTPVASECKHEYPDGDIKYPCCLCGKIEKPTTEEIIKDSQPKEVEIMEVGENELTFVNTFKCTNCGGHMYGHKVKYCCECGAKINWIA